MNTTLDLTYLLWLQGLRESLPPMVENIFVVISAIAASSALVVLPCLLYWCLDKRAGQYLLFSFSVGSLLNQLIKNTVCCYRPWIRSADIQPAAGALEGATGYSFPSGHTQAATSLIGATGVYYRRRWRVLAVLCWIFVALVAFSRNFLGVHTPQDVVVGFVLGLVVLLAMRPVLDWANTGGWREIVVLLLGTAAGAAYIYYVYAKGYPQDFDAAGKLLVDPVEMQVDCFKSGGVFFGAVLGWFFERRLLDFEVNPRELGFWRLLVRFAIGIAAVGVLHVAPRVLLLVNFDERWYELVKNFLTVFAAAFVGPALFCALERRRRSRNLARASRAGRAAVASPAAPAPAPTGAPARTAAADGRSRGGSAIRKSAHVPAHMRKR